MPQGFQMIGDLSAGLKAGLAIALVAGLALWHGHAVQSARRAGKEAAEAICAKAVRDSERDAAARLESQRSIANQALADYAAAQANFEKQIKGQQDALRKETANLAQCRLSVDAIRLLNDARSGAASDNRPAIPGLSDPLRDP